MRFILVLFAFCAIVFSVFAQQNATTPAPTTQIVVPSSQYVEITPTPTMQVVCDCKYKEDALTTQKFLETFLPTTVIPTVMTFIFIGLKLWREYKITGHVKIWEPFMKNLDNRNKNQI